MKLKWFILLFLFALATACTPQSQMLTGAERDVVLAYSEAKTDNLLTGLNDNHYATFARDFNDKMKSGVPESKFGDLQKQVVGKIGQYVSRRVDRVEQSGQWIAVVYAAKFEQDDAVTMRVVFDAAEPHRIGGLWFDSEKLRKQ